MRLSTTLLVTASAALTMMYAASAGAAPLDRFGIDQTRNIMRPENFGIANGRITIGIECTDLSTIRGIWAPPFVSSDFSLQATVQGKTIGQPVYLWRPFYIERSGAFDETLQAQTNTLLVPEGRAFIYTLKLTNHGAAPVAAPVAFTVLGTLDKMLDDASWGFGAPQSATATKVSVQAPALVLLEQGGQSLAVAVSSGLAWDAENEAFLGTIPVAPGSQATVYLIVSIGSTPDAIAQCRSLAEAPGDAVDRAEAAYNRRAAALYEKLPHLESDNAALVQFYDRSLVPFLLNRWEVPEFKLNPFYSTGSIRGGCVGEYLWNVGECPEILPIFDPDATKAHIRQFLETGVKHGFGFCPIQGTMLHPDYYYPINQEKIIGPTYHYVKNTGDLNFLGEQLGDGSILDAILSEACYLDDLSRPVALVDYNVCDPQHRGGQSHLEIRNPVGPLNYTNIMPDLNGRRYLNYVLAARLAEWAGMPRPELLDRAKALSGLLKEQLWDADRKWFAFQMPDADPPLTGYRYTVQLFYLLGTGVLDAEEEAGLLSHLNETEFLSEYGLHSLAKQDPAYLQADVDNGGPGSCTCFPLNIARNLYGMGRADMANGLLKRLLWWGERMPYWGDSFYADAMRYREETPLQCTIDAITGAQCIIFGMFGIQPHIDGSITIQPTLPPFAERVSLTGVRIRGQVFDVRVEQGQFTVSSRGNSIQAALGQRVSLTEHDARLEPPDTQDHQ